MEWSFTRYRPKYQVTGAQQVVPKLLANFFDDDLVREVAVLYSSSTLHTVSCFMHVFNNAHCM